MAHKENEGDTLRVCDVFTDEEIADVYNKTMRAIRGLGQHYYLQNDLSATLKIFAFATNEEGFRDIVLQVLSRCASDKSRLDEIIETLIDALRCKIAECR